MFIHLSGASSRFKSWSTSFLWECMWKLFWRVLMLKKGTWWGSEEEEVDGGDGCTAVWIYLIPMYCALKMIMMVMICYICFTKIKNIIGLTLHEPNSLVNWKSPRVVNLHHEALTNNFNSQKGTSRKGWSLHYDLSNHEYIQNLDFYKSFCAFFFFSDRKKQLQSLPTEVQFYNFIWICML